MSGKTEIALLERLYGSSLTGVETMSTDNVFENFVEEVIAEGQRALARAGTDGGWCYFCGSVAPVGFCDCDFTESFGCGVSGRRICVPCRNAHLAIGRHLKEMFSAKRINRVSSIRNRRYRQFRTAADGLDRGGKLRFALAQRDPLDDEPEIFRMNTLRSFQRARFLDFAGLARQLEDQKAEAILRVLLGCGLR
jgi:hypothetical protein